MEAVTRERNPRSKRWLGIGLVAAGALYVLVGFFAVPRIARNLITEIVTAQSGIVPTMESVYFDPFRIRLGIDGFELSESEGAAPLLRFEELGVNLRPMGFLSADVALDELRLVRPQLSAIRDAAGELNWVRLLTKSDPAPDSAVDASDPGMIVEIDQIQIVEGSVSFQDQSLAKPFELDVSPVDFEMRAFTTRVGEAASYDLSLATGATTLLHLTGTGQVDPLALEGKVDLRGFDLRLPSAYLSRHVQFAVDTGAVSASVEHLISMGDEFDIALTKGQITFEDVSISDARGAIDEGRDPILRIPSLLVEDVDMIMKDSVFESLDVGLVQTVGGSASVHRGEAGDLDWVSILSSPEADSAEQGPAVAPESEDVAPAADPRVRVAEVRIRDFSIDVEDRSVTPAAKFAWPQISISAKGDDNAPGTAFDLQVESKLGKRGELNLSGPLALAPLSAQLAVTATDLPLSPFSGYVGASKAALTEGSLSAQLDVELAAADEESRSSSSASTSGWSVKGNLEVGDLRATDARTDTDLIRWRSLRFDGLDLTADQFVVEGVELDDAFARVEIAKNGRSNFQEIFGGASSQDAVGQPSPPRAEPKIEVPRVRIGGAKVDLVDQSISPRFKTSLSDLGGVLSGLSSTSRKQALVNLEGKVDGTAPLEVKGKINPFQDDVASQLQIQLTGVSMPILAPYSGRFIGYGIDRGKLDLDLDYQLNGRVLEATNHFTLERFSFGKKVESAEATSLPVPLALGLMRGRGGVINIDLPVSGNIDDPSFNILRLLTRAFTQLISKVATAPFAVLGGIVGFSAADLSSVVFAPGSVDLNDAEQVEIARLAEALAEKPGLNVEIRGRADSGLDGFQLGTEEGDEMGKHLARARAVSIRDALLENSTITAERIFLNEVELGDFGSETQVSSELSLVGG